MISNADGSKTVKVTVFVDKDSAGPLTAGKERIEDILVLHLQGGKDIFVSFLLGHAWMDRLLERPFFERQPIYKML